MAEQCTIFRWSRTNSGTIVRANRSYNIETIQSDIDMIKNVPWDGFSSSDCLVWITSGVWLNGYFWRNSWLYIDTNKAKTGEMILKSGFDEKWALVPLFDIKGSKSINDTNIWETSYLNCLDNNYYLSRINRFEDNWIRSWYVETTYQTPIFWSPINWTCNTVNSKSSYSKTFDQLFAEWKCSGLTCIDGNKTSNFKIIPSHVIHKSPTSNELSWQIQLWITPSLPIDKNRYIDFMANDWSYKKVEYEYLYRWFSWSTLSEIKKEIKDRLEDKTIELSNLNNITWGSVPFLEQTYTWKIDLYNDILSKENKILKIWEDEKELSYIDSLAFAIVWNNLNSVSAKYKFILENYLNDQFINTEDSFNIPKNKKQYEIAYLWAYWDPENMYIQMNPESKGDNPYADIVQKNASLQSKLLGQNIWNSNSDSDKDTTSAVFKCAPPEWVPIFEWIPAIVCWLDDMLPPTITVNESTCWPTLPLLSNEDKEYLEQCNWDTDKNWINDCLENKLKGGSINNYSDSNKYYYNKPGKLKAELLDSEGNILSFDNHTKVKFELLKIEWTKNIDKIFNNSNKELLYSAWDDISIAKKYINFIEIPVWVKSGIAEMQFTTKALDVNYYFQSSLEVINSSWEKEISILWDEIKIEVRWDRLFSTSYNLNDNIDTGIIEAKIWNWAVIANTVSQIFMIDKNQQSINDIKNQIYSKNDSINKLVISLENLSKSWNQLDISYPLTIKLYDENNQLIEDSTINKNQLNNFYEFFGLTKSGHITLEIIDADWYKTKKEIDVLPSVPSKLDLSMWATVLESDWAVTSNVVTIFCLLYTSPSPRD